MVLIIKGELFHGQSLDEAFGEYWRSKRGKPIYSPDRNVFLQNVAEWLAISDMSTREAARINVDRELTQIERNTEEKLIDARSSLPSAMAAAGLMTPTGILALGECVDAVRISQETPEERDQINDANRALSPLIGNARQGNGGAI